MTGKFKKVAHVIAQEIVHEDSVIRSFFSKLSLFTKRLTFVLIVMYTITSVVLLTYGTKIWQNNKIIAKELKDTQAKDKESQKVGEYTLFIMNMRETKMSDFQKQLMAQTIVRVSGNIFDSYEERTWFVILINNESGFERLAKSPSGAVGLTQVMPQFVEEFGGHCGISDINPTEVTDMEVNLTLGACRFKHLLSNYKGVYSTALAAYNGGKNAKSVKELQRLANITTEETLQYLARFTHIKASADANEKNNPDKGNFVTNAKVKIESK